MIFKYKDLTHENWLHSDFKVVVFGGSGGIGGRLVRVLARNYNTATLSSKDVDVVNAEAVREFMDLHDPDVVINFSGVNYNSLLHKYNTYLEAERLINVNIWGNIHILTNALKKMREKNFGRIILASSVLSHKTVAGTSLYAASKSFLDTMVRVAAVENARHGITINTLRMGYFDGGLTYTIPPEIRENIKNEIPVGKFGQVMDLYGIIDCLIQNEYMTGANIDINGGLNGL